MDREFRLKLRNLNASCASHVCKSRTIERFFWREKRKWELQQVGWNSGGAWRWRRERGVVESKADDDGEKRTQEAPRADGDCGAEVCEWIWAAGAGAGCAALFAWRHREGRCALDGVAAGG